MKKLNDAAKWIVLGLALAGIAYNVIVSKTIVQNDLKHFGERLTKIEVKVEKLCDFLMKKP